LHLHLKPEITLKYLDLLGKVKERHLLRMADLKGNLKMSNSNQKITTFLTFPGNAEEAMNFYISVFPNSRILQLTLISKDNRGEVGKVLNGTFELKNQQFMVMDMEKSYVPAFTWATSLYVECEDEKEFDTLFEKLSINGKVIMGPEPILSLMKVAWVADQFGVTWQLIFK